VVGWPVTIEDDIAFLARVPAFAKFSFAALQIVAIGSETRTIPDGETLFSAGDTTDAGYVIQAGSLMLTTNDPRPSEPGVVFGTGALIGELALVTETVCSATAVATEQTTVIRISRNLFRKVLEGFPEAASAMRNRLMVRVDQSNVELAHLRAMLRQEKAGNSAVNNARAGNTSMMNPPAGTRSGERVRR
jgi:CRP-like cAMP-binding protein